MISQSLLQLPPPPHGKSGWPWSEEMPPLPKTMPDGSPWPRISIVTPSYNQVQFIEETIRSVLLQGYPNLEYIIIDGGSTDGSLEIIKKYETWLSYWVSEPDKGQSDAINKGFQHSTGQIMAWLNSDDLYYPGTLEDVAIVFHQFSANTPTILMGNITRFEYKDGKRIYTSTIEPKKNIFDNRIFRSPGCISHVVAQPSMFWMRNVWAKVGALNKTFNYTMDMEWLTRSISRGVEVKTTENFYSLFRDHPLSKTSSKVPWFYLERAKMFAQFSIKPEFNFWPCIKALRSPLIKGLKFQSDAYCDKDKYVHALVCLLCALPFNGLQRGTSIKKRLSRILSRLFLKSEDQQ